MNINDLISEDPFGTQPQRPARSGARPARGHEPQARYNVKKDPELDKAEKFAKGHYGNTDPEQALEKWMVHALKHSEESDKEQNAKIAQLDAKIAALEKTKQMMSQPQNMAVLQRLAHKESLAEVSDETKASYKEKAQKQIKELEPHAKKGEYKDIAKRMIDRREKGLKRVAEGNHPVCEHCGCQHEQALDEHGKASRALCLSSRTDNDIGASNLSSCKSQGLRARTGKKSHKLGKSSKSRVKVGGHKIKGKKYGGPLPDWSESVNYSSIGKALLETEEDEFVLQLLENYNRLNESYDPQVLAMQKELKAKGADLGPFGPNQDGLDGRMGPYTRRAAQANPDIAAKYKEILDKPDSVTASAIDTTVIQDPDFQQKLQKIASNLGTSTNALLAVMQHESGVKPYKVNPTSGATGLIQFMPSTAQRLGTNVQDLKQMDAVQQLDFVYKYYKMTGVGDGSVGDLYVATFMPKYLGYPPSTVLGQRGASGFAGLVYDQNSVLDRNGDGQITIADIKNSVQRFA